MYKVKRKLVLAIVIALLCIEALLTSCTSKKNETNEKKISVVTTIFPIYDITKELCKGCNDIKVTLLMDSGVDLHNYSPTSKDLIDISESDAFIYIGGESDEWVDEAFASLNIDKSKQVNLMSHLSSSLKEEELKEGMEDEEENEEGIEGEEEIEYDEHIWLSVRNAKGITKAISEKLCSIVSDNDKKTINENTDKYIDELTSLDNDYKLLVANAKENNLCTTLLFADRFPFRYLVEDYGLDYYAAFKGCSAESEASFKTVVFLADKINELNLKNIFVLDDSDMKIANTVIETSKKEKVGILILDSMQSKTVKDVENGVSYMDIMKINLETLSLYFNEYIG